MARAVPRLALEFAGAPSSVAYSRVGAGCGRHATLACYAVELLNIVAGRLGQPGGSMFPAPAVDVIALSRMAGADGGDGEEDDQRGSAAEPEVR